MAKVKQAHVEVWYAYYRDNHSLRQTSREFGVDEALIRYHFDQRGYKRRTISHGLALYNDTRAETLIMYQEYIAGATYRAIGEKYHYSPDTIRFRFKRNNLPLRGRIAA